MSIWTSGSVLLPSDTEILVTIKYLLTSFTGDTKFPAHHGHFLTIEKPGHKPETFIHSITPFSGHSESSSKYLNHRGVSANAPENSLAAIELAIKEGADWVELDVHERIMIQLASFIGKQTTRPEQ